MTPLEIATDWYRENEVAERINHFLAEDVGSPEFVTWLTNELREAMAKGIEIGEGNSP